MAVGDVHVFPGFLTQVLTQISFEGHRILFSHASAEVRGENRSERNFASTGSRTHNHQVTSPTRSPVTHPGGAQLFEGTIKIIAQLPNPYIVLKICLGSLFRSMI